MKWLQAVALSMLCTALQLHGQTRTDYSIVVGDGVTLESTLALPDSAPPPAGWPTIVLVHGYGGSKSEWVGVDSYLTSLGFGCFMYSVRGQGNSGGLSTTMGPRERQDLLEVIQYLRKLPHVDSNAIAVAGGSQGGIHSWMAAVYRMPGVRVIASLIGPPSFSFDLLPGGCIKQQMWAELNLSAVRYDPLRDHVRDFIVADLYDSIYAYVASRDLEHLLDSVTIPVFQSLGWADILFPVNGGIRTLQRLTPRGIPVWSYFGTNGHGELNLAEYYYVVTGVIAPWFSRWLKSVPLDSATSPVVVYADDRPDWPHHEIIGWPPQPQGTLRLYLSGTSLKMVLPTASSESPFTLSYDSSYTPSKGWNDGYSGTGFTGAFQSSAARFISDPVADTVEITGVPHATLQVRSTAVRFQSNLRVFDLAPTDTGLVWTLITRGARGFRGNPPGSSQRADLECQALSHLVMPGHRIGIEVASLDMYNATRCHIVPFFNSSASVVSSSSLSPSYVDLPIVGGATLVSVPVAAVATPTATVLQQNYPNPFNPNTRIGFSLPAGRQAGQAGVSGPGSRWVRLEVVNVLGQTVAVLLDGAVQPGQHTVEFNGAGLATGMYFCRLITNQTVAERKMLLVR